MYSRTLPTRAVSNVASSIPPRYAYRTRAGHRPPAILCPGVKGPLCHRSPPEHTARSPVLSAIHAFETLSTSHQNPTCPYERDISEEQDSFGIQNPRIGRTQRGPLHPWSPDHDERPGAVPPKVMRRLSLCRIQRCLRFMSHYLRADARSYGGRTGCAVRPQSKTNAS